MVCDVTALAVCSFCCADKAALFAHSGWLGTGGTTCTAGGHFAAAVSLVHGCLVIGASVLAVEVKIVSTHFIATAHIH